MIFALDFLNNRELCTPKLSCHLRISKSLYALLFRCSMNVSFRTCLRVGSSRHVFIETLQSKDFSEILLICVNFGVTASRFCQNILRQKSILTFHGHKKYCGVYHFSGGKFEGTKRQVSENRDICRFILRKIFPGKAILF